MSVEGMDGTRTYICWWLLSLSHTHCLKLMYHLHFIKLLSISEFRLLAFCVMNSLNWLLAFGLFLPACEFAFHRINYQFAIGFLNWILYVFLPDIAHMYWRLSLLYQNWDPLQRTSFHCFPRFVHKNKKYV